MSWAPFLAPSRSDAFRMGRAFIPAGTNYYVWPGVLLGANGTLAFAPNTDYYAAFRTRTPFTFDQVAGEVSATGAGNLRWGLYAADANLQPVGPPLFDSGDISVSTGGVKTYTPASPITIPAGRYLTAQNQSATCSLRVYRDGDWQLQATTLGNTNFPTILKVARSYDAFPTPGTAWTGFDTSTLVGLQAPYVFRMTAP